MNEANLTKKTQPAEKVKHERKFGFEIKGYKIKIDAYVHTYTDEVRF